MKLNIYGKKDGKKQITKTYEVKEYDLMFGTIEDLLKHIDLENVGELTDGKIIQIVSGLMANSMGTVKDLLMDMFDGLTEKEIRSTTVKEVAKCLVDVIIYTVIEVEQSFAWGSEKKAGAAESR